MVAMETKKDNFSVIIATVATRKKNFFKNLNLIDLITTAKIGLIESL